MRKQESGASAIDYVLIVALIVAMIVGVIAFGIKTTPKTPAANVEQKK